MQTSFCRRAPLLFFTAVFIPQRVFPRESVHKTLINTVFCVRLSQIEFPHTYILLLHPVSATKLTFEATWKMSNFRISFFQKKVASHRSGKNHCGNFCNSAPQPPRSVNGQPCRRGDPADSERYMSGSRNLLPKFMPISSFRRVSRF